MKHAPVALFAFRRPLHLRQTVDALRANGHAAETPLYVFCDGPRDEADVAAVDAVRRYVDSIDGFASVEIKRSPRNMGLAASIVSGVTMVLAKHGRVIVLEDDLVTSPAFLNYMNAALELYVTQPRVASIHGYVYPLRHAVPETFFLRGADCWGWATWSRAWSVFNPDALHLLKELEARQLTYTFDLDGSAHFTEMLRKCLEGQVDSWAIRWHASAFLADMLTLYPGQSLVQNIGLDASGTHGENTTELGGSVTTHDVRVAPIPVVESDRARAAFVDFFGGQKGNRPSAVEGKGAGIVTTALSVIGRWSRALR